MTPVAKFLLPVPVSQLAQFVDILTAVYGKDLRMTQEGEWLVIVKEEVHL
jgi:hypothetical protein